MTTAWGILSIVSWHVGRRLAALGWLLFFLAGGVLIALGVAGDTLFLVAFFALLICGLGFIFADLYLNGRHESHVTT